MGVGTCGRACAFSDIVVNMPHAIITGWDDRSCAMDWTLCHRQVRTLLGVVSFGSTTMVSSCTLAAIIANSSWTIFARASMSLPSHPQAAGWWMAPSISPQLFKLSTKIYLSQRLFEGYLKTVVTVVHFFSLLATIRPNKKAQGLIFATSTNPL